MWSEIGYLICVIHLFTLTAVLDMLFFTRAQRVLIYHLIYKPWAASGAEKNCKYPEQQQQQQQHLSNNNKSATSAASILFNNKDELSIKERERDMQTEANIQIVF